MTKNQKIFDSPKIGDLVARMGVSDTGYILGEITEIVEQDNKKKYKVIWNDAGGAIEELHNEGYIRSAAWSMKLYREVNMME